MEKKEITRAVGSAVSLTSWEGAVSGSVLANNYTTHQISTLLPSNKIVVVSLSTTSNTSGAFISLLNVAGAAMPLSGGWYEKSRMTYFKTTGSSTYTIKITSSISINYTVKVVVADIIPQFIPADCLSYAEYADSTYMISSSPEELSSSLSCRGDLDKRYLARGRLKGRARLYWEHYNQYGTPMKFGVLLWNKGSTEIRATLVCRSVKSGAIEAASLGVWVDCFNDIKQADNSQLPTNGYVSIPAYNASNPSASAVWVALSTIQAGSPGFFNGVLSLALTNPNGSLYLGNNILCDTYIMASETSIKSNISSMALTPISQPDDQLLRGSGSGSVLSATISNTITISPSNPYNILITGLDLPLLQLGEKITIRTYNANGAVVATRENGVNYGVWYRFVFSGFSSNSTIKAKVRYRDTTNPNAAAYNDAGLYVAGFIQGQSPFSKLLLKSPGEYVFNSNLPKNQQVILNVVVSGMSSMPLEISFFN